MDQALKVLILCNDFPPLNSIGARRPYSWWKYLKRYNIEPVVITKHWPDKTESLYDLMQQIESSGIYYDTIVEESQYGTIIRVKNNLAIYEKLLLYRKGILWIVIRKCITFIWRFLSFLFPKFDKHWNLYLEAVRFVVQNNIDVVITTGEPFILHKYGYLLKKKFKVKWIADYRDGWFLNHTTRFSYNPIIWLERQWEKIFEKKYVWHSDAISAAFPVLCEELKMFFNNKKQVYLIINGYEELAEKTTRSETGFPLIFTFGGNVVKGQRYDLFLEAIYQLKQQKEVNIGDILIQFIGGAFDPKQKKLLYPYTDLLSGFLVMTPRIEITRARQICADSDYLLLFLIPNYKNIPSKLFEYLSLQRPILVIPNDKDVVEEIVNNVHAGIFCSDVQSIKDFVLAQINFKKQGGTIASTNILDESIFQYSREYQTKLLVDIILKV